MHYMLTVLLSVNTKAHRYLAIGVLVFSARCKTLGINLADYQEVLHCPFF